MHRKLTIKMYHRIALLASSKRVALLKRSFESFHYMANPVCWLESDRQS